MNCKSIMILIVLLVYKSLSAQEWKSFSAYQKNTGNKELQAGYWLKKDRKKQTEVWKNANIFNLSEERGSLKYTSISQIRDFYKWSDQMRIKKGHEINAAGIGAIAATQLSYL